MWIVGAVSEVCSYSVHSYYMDNKMSPHCWSWFGRICEVGVAEAYLKCIVLESGCSDMDIRLLNAEELSSNGESFFAKQAMMNLDWSFFI